MTQVFVPWYYALRGLALRTPEGPKTSSGPLVPPPGLEPPRTLGQEENGYYRLAMHVSAWPSEGANPPDLSHRLKRLPGDRKPAEQALAPLRPLLDGLDDILQMPNWQVPVGADMSWPELVPIRRLGQALLLRHALEGSEDDREKVLRVAGRLRRSQSPMIHFLVGISLERLAQGSFEGLREDRKDAMMAELTRVIIPTAHLHGPWDPVPWELPNSWLDEVRSVRWLLANHPKPFDPSSTIDLLVQRQTLLLEGSSQEIDAEAARLVEGWPPSMLHRLPQPSPVPITTLRRYRSSVAALENPYGRLNAARALQSAAALAQAVEKVTSS